jgi:CRISPR-associated protein Csb2
MSTPIQSLSSVPVLSPLGIDRRLSLAVFELTNLARLRIVHALPFAEQVRRALIRNRVDTSHSEAITGKTAAGVPLEGHEHAYYFAMDEEGDGRLDHVTIHCPRGFNEADIEALGSLRTIYRRGNAPDVRMILIALGGVELVDEGVHLPSKVASITGNNRPLPQAVLTGRSSQAGTAMTRQRPEGISASPPSRSGYRPVGTSILASSERWRSMTPFSLPRFPYRADRKPRPSESAESQLIRELRSRGLPEPITVKRIEGYQANGRPLVRWLEFHTRRFNGTQGKGLAGFEIEFAQPVAGPIALGFGCHFGLGLFVPC